MKNLPFDLDLSGKTVVITGGGGVLCSGFAKTAAACKAKVAVLDLKKEAADKVAMRSTPRAAKQLPLRPMFLTRPAWKRQKRLLTKNSAAVIF